jgi:hypothetical protein
MLNLLLWEQIMRERQAQRERDVERAHLLREAARAQRPSRGKRRTPFRGRAAAGLEHVGGYLACAGRRLRAAAAVATAALPCFLCR